MPRNDLLDTDTMIGMSGDMRLRFRITARSLDTQLPLILVWNGPSPFRLKNPIDGSSTILLVGMDAVFAISRLSCSSLDATASCFPCTGRGLYAHNITDAP